MVPAADHQMIVHLDAQGLSGGGDLPRHGDVAAAGRGIPAGMVVHQATNRTYDIENNDIFSTMSKWWDRGLGAAERVSSGSSRFLTVIRRESS